MHTTTTVVGYLTDDPQLVKVKEGTYVCKMRVASSRRVRRLMPISEAPGYQNAQESLQASGYDAGSSGSSESPAPEPREKLVEQWIDADHFFVDVECWGQMATNCKLSLGRGMPVMVVGYMTTANWVDAEQNRKSKPLLKAQQVGLELSRYVAGSRKSEPNDIRLVKGCDVPGVSPQSNTDELVDADYSVADTAADAAASEQTKSAQDEAARGASESEKKPRTKTTTKTQEVKEAATPF